MAAEVDASVAAPKKLWGGRFTGATDPLMEKFNESLPFDQRMWAEDIRVRTRAVLCIPCMSQQHMHNSAGAAFEGGPLEPVSHCPIHRDQVTVSQNGPCKRVAARVLPGTACTRLRPQMHAQNEPCRPAQGSQAYARALAKAGVLTEDEAATIVSGLDTVAAEWETGVFKVHAVPLWCMSSAVSRNMYDQQAVHALFICKVLSCDVTVLAHFAACTA